MEFLASLILFTIYGGAIISVVAFAAAIYQSIKGLWSFILYGCGIGSAGLSYSAMLAFERFDPNLQDSAYSLILLPAILCTLAFFVTFGKKSS